jgi:hypothetical protein
MGRDLLISFAIGALGGAAAAGAVWAYASHALDAQLAAGGSQLSTGIQEGRATLETRLRQGEAELQNQIRTQVNAAMDQRLTAVGLDATTGNRINRLLALADSTGLLNGLNGFAGRSYYQ